MGKEKKEWRLARENKSSNIRNDRQTETDKGKKAKEIENVEKTNLRWIQMRDMDWTVET